MENNFIVKPVIDVVTPVLTHELIPRINDNGNNLNGMHLHAHIQFPHRAMIVIYLNDYLKNYFERHLSKRIERITEARRKLLANMPRISIKGIEVYRESEPIYRFTNEYLDIWLQPIIHKL